ncbi:MAG: hypothetical protein LBT99_01580 [Bifidobacteriaceae bacterium]|jgi:hypothetical protein|nr:hypothetical protein [Bifidobacteriaceae bacterium]
MSKVIGRDLSYIFILGLFMTFLTVNSIFNSKAEAVEMSNWDAGQIITDGSFWTTGKMSKTDIQNFLNSKNSTCVSNGDNKCLKDYVEKTSTKSSDAYCSGTFSGSNTDTAASIISKASQACKVNEKVLLTMLQKEQGLVTALWAYYVDPNGVHSNDDSHFKSAMGMGCPDTAACDSKYYGFSNQVYNAARQLNVYRITQSYNYKPYKDNYIQYNPNTSCGGSNIYISNWATAALYTYTPYQPNAAALANPYGTGDNCSAYGNRNFFRIFYDWFGRPNSYYVKGAIANKYNDLGGVNARLADPTSYELPVSGKGVAQTFQGGNIYWRSLTGGTYAVWGAIKSRYSSLGGSGGFLGFPTTDELSAASVTVQVFESGSIYWIKSSGKTFITKGAIRNKYNSKGGTASFLGLPKSEELGADGVGQIFDNGKIFWSQKIGAFITSGGIGNLYNEMGSRTSKLGYPISDEIVGDTYTYQKFEGGQIRWTKTKGAWTVYN